MQKSKEEREIIKFLYATKKLRSITIELGISKQVCASLRNYFYKINNGVTSLSVMGLSTERSQVVCFSW